MHIDKSLLCCNWVGTFKKNLRFLPSSSLPLSFCVSVFLTFFSPFSPTFHRYSQLAVSFLKEIFSTIKDFGFNENHYRQNLNQYVFWLVRVENRGVNIAGHRHRHRHAPNVVDLCLQNFSSYIIILNYFLLHSIGLK